MTSVMCSMITEYVVGYEQSTQDAIDVLEMAAGRVIKHQMLVVLLLFFLKSKLFLLLLAVSLAAMPKTTSRERTCHSVPL